jgi:hypothetical protein
MMDTMSSRHDVMGIGGLTKACKRLSEAAKTLSTRHYVRGIRRASTPLNTRRARWNAIEGDGGRKRRGDGTHSDHRRCGPTRCAHKRENDRLRVAAGGGATIRGETEEGFSQSPHPTTLRFTTFTTITLMSSLRLF